MQRVEINSTGYYKGCATGWGLHFSNSIHYNRLNVQTFSKELLEWGRTLTVFHFWGKKNLASRDLSTGRFV